MRFQTGCADGGFQVCNQEGVLFQHVAHVPVLLLDLHGDPILPAALVDAAGDFQEAVLPKLEMIPIKVPDDQTDLRVLAVRLHGGHVVEAVHAVGELGFFERGQSGQKFRGQVGGVDHDALGGGRMDAAAGDFDEGFGGVEGLILIPAQVIAVDRIGKLCAEPFQIQVLRKAANLLVGGEGDADAPVGQLGVPGVVFRQGHHSSDGGLVVAAQQGGSVGEDQVLADVLGKVRIVCSAHDDALGLVEHDISAGVGTKHPGLDVPALDVRRGIHVGDQGDGSILVHVCGRQPAVDDAVRLIEFCPNAELVQLTEQEPGQVPLAGRGGPGSVEVLGLGRYSGIAEQSLLGLPEKFRIISHSGLRSSLSELQLPVQQEQQPGQPDFFFFRIRSSASRTIRPTAARME